MSLTFECGDKNALVAYLYEECEPELRDVISGHLARCESCSSEIDGLGWTRQRLEVWTPPMPALGFQLPVPAQEVRLPWWRAPLPAWAQAAAAVLKPQVAVDLGEEGRIRVPGPSRGFQQQQPTGIGGHVPGLDASGHVPLLERPKPELGLGRLCSHKRRSLLA